MNNYQEVPFKSGESADEVVRIGNTVRRSLCKNSKRVHKIYLALAEGGYIYSPRYIGLDEKGREVITYIEGETIDDSVLSIKIAIQSIKRLREFHDILSATEISEDQETVCHRDFAPWNILHSNGQVVGIIDFDAAYPGKRLADLAYACWTFLKLGNQDNAKGNDEQISELTKLVRAYGEIDTHNFVNELLSEQNRILKHRRGRIEELGIDVGEKNNREIIYKEIIHQINWVQNNLNAIIEKLRK